MADLKRPAPLNSNALPDLLRWNKHTTDNIDALNAALGSSVESIVPAASAIALTTATFANVTTLTLTEPGIYLISAGVIFTGAPTGTFTEAGWSTTSKSPGTRGDTDWTSPTVPTAAAPQTITIPPKPLTVSETTVLYLVGAAGFSAGAVSAYGRISAVRVN